VPSPYVRWRFGRRRTLGAEGCGLLVVRDGLRARAEGGRGGMGYAVHKAGKGISEIDGPAKTPDNAGRVFRRVWVGIVRRSAAGLEEGVEGLVGGTLKSCIRLVEFLCDLARDAAVGSS
jgi:hypothetical protein